VPAGAVDLLDDEAEQGLEMVEVDVVEDCDHGSRPRGRGTRLMRITSSSSKVPDDVRCVPGGTPFRANKAEGGRLVKPRVRPALAHTAARGSRRCVADPTRQHAVTLRVCRPAEEAIAGFVGKPGTPSRDEMVTLGALGQASCR
jgi:hypothetical protein